MILAAFSRSSLPAYRRSDSLHCRRVSRTQATDFESYVLDLQSSIKSEAERLEADSGKAVKFQDDRWERNPESGNAGYGITSVLEGGTVLEKAAANVSVINGTLSPERAQAMSERGRSGINMEGGDPYSAVAMSLVFHSAHPFIPTLRADVRMFKAGDQQWFGGGCDLTPNFLTHMHPDSSAATDLTGDIQAFHSSWKSLCDRHSPALYPEYKAWCDRYFYIPCRQEHRGTGGIFFDDLDSSSSTSVSASSLSSSAATPSGDDPHATNVASGVDAEAFTQEVGRNIVSSWADIVAARRALPFTDAQREWQELRRGRYIEFNLLYDRGVRFGLEGGRIESIMVSAPPRVRWQYMKSVQPAEGSPEHEMLQVLQQPREWAGHSTV